MVATSPVKAAMTALTSAAHTISQYPGSAYVLGPQHPAEIVNSSDVGRAPQLLGFLVSAAAAASLAAGLAASVRRRRHELALVRALGFTARQLTASIRWQAATTVGAG